MDFTEKGVVLKVGRFRESDAWVRFLTPGRGIMQAMAFGGMRSKKRFSGCLDPFNHVLFTVGSSKGGQYQDLREGVLLHGFSGIKTDNARLNPASACLKFTEAVIKGSAPSVGAYELLLETLHLLEEMDRGMMDVPVLYRAKLAFEQGYSPDFHACASCGAQHGPDKGAFDKPIFFVEKGQVLCSQCAPARKPGFADPQMGPGLPLSWGALRTLAFVQEHPPAAWTRLAVDPTVRDEAYRAVDRFLAYHLDVTLDNGIVRNT